MNRFHLGAVFIVLYIGWVFYRALIKKDIKHYKNDFYFYTFFIAVWLMLYYWFFFKEINHFINNSLSAG